MQTINEEAKEVFLFHEFTWNQPILNALFNK